MRIGSWRRGEKHMSASTHFKSLCLICVEPETKKKVVLQRSYHSVSRVVSWSDNSRQSRLGTLLPLDECFSNVFCFHSRGWIVLLFPFVEAVVKRFLDTLPFCLLSRPSVTLDFKPHPHPRPNITACPHHSPSLSTAAIYSTYHC